MSRTYRKSSEDSWLYREWTYVNGCFMKVPKVPTKKELALHKADGKGIKYGCYPKRSHRRYLSRGHRKFRANDRKQKALLKVNPEHEWDNSKPYRYWKGIMWVIY